MKNNCKTILKAVLFSFIVSLLLAVVMISDARRILSGLTSLGLILGILIVYCTLFSVIKADTVNFRLYNIVSVLSHIVFTLLTFLIAGYFYHSYGEQDKFLLKMTEILSLFACFVAVIIDSITCLANKKLGR